MPSRSNGSLILKLKITSIDAMLVKLYLVELFRADNICGSTNSYLPVGTIRMKCRNIISTILLDFSD